LKQQDVTDKSSCSHRRAASTPRILVTRTTVDSWCCGPVAIKPREISQ
jgi:hypothetical protein